MNKVYCPDCGAPNQYGYSKPKFCGECGTAFGAVKTTKTDSTKKEESELMKKYSKVFMAMGVDPNEAESSETKSWANLDKLSCKFIEEDDENRVINLGELVGAPRSAKNKRSR